MVDIHNSRRGFLKKVSMAGIALTASANLDAMNLVSNSKDLEKDKDLVFLFQGDSITDGNRGRSKDPNHILGHGYAFSIASKLGSTFPQKNLSFYNRGISGNKVTDLAARWQKDTLDIKPDVLSILIGVNDTGSMMKTEGGVSVEKYEETYSNLLNQTREQLPNCLFVLCEPFIKQLGNPKLNWAAWQEDMGKRQAIVRKLADEYKAIFVPLQDVFDKADNHVPEDYWIWDGVHPTYSGHGLITTAWMKEVSNRIHFLKKM